jgi:hypothetical protein
MPTSFGLQPAVDATSLIRGNLIYVPLIDCPSYGAISYTWCDDTTSHHIYTDADKSPLEVRTNCYNLQYHVHPTDGICMLWIDAICIDPPNTDERGHQVRMMEIIYDRASSGVVYLGEYSDRSAVLFSESDRLLELPIPAISKALDQLLQRPWFRRA